VQTWLHPLEEWTVVTIDQRGQPLLVIRSVDLVLRAFVRDAPTDVAEKPTARFRLNDLARAAETFAAS
jgi:hypothetical protein